MDEITTERVQCLSALLSYIEALDKTSIESSKCTDSFWARNLVESLVRCIMEESTSATLGVMKGSEHGD